MQPPQSNQAALTQYKRPTDGSKNTGSARPHKVCPSQAIIAPPHSKSTTITHLPGGTYGDENTRASTGWSSSGAPYCWNVPPPYWPYFIGPSGVYYYVPPPYWPYPFGPSGAYYNGNTLSALCPYPLGPSSAPLSWPPPALPSNAECAPMAILPQV